MKRSKLIRSPKRVGEFRLNERIRLSWDKIDDVTDNYLKEYPYKEILDQDKGTIKEVEENHCKVSFRIGYISFYDILESRIEEVTGGIKEGRKEYTQYETKVYRLPKYVLESSGKILKGRKTRRHELIVAC